MYQGFLNIPYQGYTDNQYMIKNNGAELVNLYIKHLALISMLKPEFHMQKRFDFWDFFKACKNSFAKKMIREISSSTVREIRKWKGSPENMFTTFSASMYTPEETKKPLEKYKLLFKQYESYLN